MYKKTLIRAQINTDEKEKCKNFVSYLTNFSLYFMVKDKLFSKIPFL